jgi:hypothetical protein
LRLRDLATSVFVKPDEPIDSKNLKLFSDFSKLILKNWHVVIIEKEVDDTDQALYRYFEEL